MIDALDMSPSRNDRSESAGGLGARTSDDGDGVGPFS